MYKKKTIRHNLIFRSGNPRNWAKTATLLIYYRAISQDFSSARLSGFWGALPPWFFARASHSRSGALSQFDPNDPTSPLPASPYSTFFFEKNRMKYESIGARVRNIIVSRLQIPVFVYTWSLARAVAQNCEFCPQQGLFWEWGILMVRLCDFLHIY